MSSYRRIAEQVITLLTILISIAAALREAGKSPLPLDLTVTRELTEHAEKLPATPLGDKIRTKVR
jgi:hypothetical protein